MKVILAQVRQDAGLVGEIYDWLCERGVWVERWELALQDSLVERVRDEVQPPDRMVIGLSPLSLAAKWVRQEVTGGALIELAEARGFAERFVLPVLLRPCEVPIWLRDRLAANFANKEFEVACAELAVSIAGVTGHRSDGALSNRIFRSWTVEPIGAGKHAVVLEFGVCTQRTQGLHVEIDLGARYTATKDWFGPPNLPRVPSRPGGPFFNSSLRREPPLYARKFGEPEITPSQSYYLYVEAEEPIHVTERLFVDAFGREI